MFGISKLLARLKSLKTMLVLLTLANLIAVVFLSFDPNAYFSHAVEHQGMANSTWQDAHWRWPWQGVLFTITAMLLEIMLLWFVLFAKRIWKMWLRGLCSLILTVPWFALCLLYLFQAPAYLIWHMYWLTGIVASLALIALVQTFRTVLNRRNLLGKPPAK